MKIDVLSQNTLKLTLSKLDMFDLDIKYESLSGKNPETKRLLAHVIKSIQSDKQVSFDFSGERLFIEAFPRIDGGCMLYISCLEEDSVRDTKKNRRAKQTTESADKSERTARVPLWRTPVSEAEDPLFLNSNADLTVNNLPMYKTTELKGKGSFYVCELQNAGALAELCRILRGIAGLRGYDLRSSLYFRDGVYRLAVACGHASHIRGIMNEFGSVLSSDDSLAVTEEYFRLLADNNAIELINNCF